MTMHNALLLPEWPERMTLAEILAVRMHSRKGKTNRVNESLVQKIDR